jgi:hypothetical protein
MDGRIDNIKMDLLEIGLNIEDRIGLAQDRYRCVCIQAVRMMFSSIAFNLEYEQPT